MKSRGHIRHRSPNEKLELQVPRQNIGLSVLEERHNSLEKPARNVLEVRSLTELKERRRVSVDT